MTEYQEDPKMELMWLVEFGTIVTSILMTLSGIPLCMDIWKTKDAKFFPVGLFTYVCGPTCIMSMFGYYTDDKLNLYLNIFGTIMNVIYLMVYASIEKDLSFFKKYVALTITFLVFLSTYVSQFVPRTEDRADVLGSVGGIMFTSMVFGPVIDIYNTIKSGDTRNIPVPFLIAATLNCSCWLTYGLLRNDFYTAVPNVPFLALNCVQFSTLLYYGKPDTKKID